MRAGPTGHCLPRIAFADADLDVLSGLGGMVPVDGHEERGDACGEEAVSLAADDERVVELNQVSQDKPCL